MSKNQTTNTEDPAQPAKRPQSSPLRERVKQTARRLDIYGVQRVGRKRRPNMKHLWWYGTLASSSGAFYFSFVSLYALAIGATRTQVGWISSAASLMGALGPMVGVALVRRVRSRKRIVVFFSILFRLMLLMAALVPLFFSGQAAIYMLIVFFALRLGMVTIMNPAAMALMGELIPIKVRGHYLSRRNMAMALGSMIFVPLAGWMIDRVGEPVGYQVGLVIAFILGNIGTWKYAQIQEPEPAAMHEASPDGEELPQLDPRPKQQGESLLKVLFGNKLLLGFVLIRFVWNFSMQVAGPYFTVYHKEVLLATTQLIGTLSTVAAFTRLIGQNVWGRMLDKKGTKWVFVIVNLFIPIMPFIWIFATKAWHIAFVNIPGGFLMAGFNLAAVNLLLTLPKPENRSQAAALHSMAVHGANIIGPLIGDLVISSLGYEWAFAISGIGRFIAGILFMLVLKPFTFKDIGNTVVSTVGWIRGGRRMGLGTGPVLLDKPSDSSEND